MSQEIQQKEQDTYQLFEDQDRLIIDGITMLSTRLNHFYDIIRQHGLDLPEAFRREQLAWNEEYKQIHHQLTNWEISNLGKQTFSHAFELVIDYIMTAKAKDTRTTIAERARQIKSNVDIKNDPTSVAFTVRRRSNNVPKTHRNGSARRSSSGSLAAKLKRSNSNRKQSIGTQQPNLHSHRIITDLADQPYKEEMQRTMEKLRQSQQSLKIMDTNLTDRNIQRSQDFSVSGIKVHSIGPGTPEKDP